jgi:hypothetical protein
LGFGNDWLCDVGFDALLAVVSLLAIVTILREDEKADGEAEQVSMS